MLWDEGVSARTLEARTRQKYLDESSGYGGGGGCRGSGSARCSGPPPGPVFPSSLVPRPSSPVRSPLLVPRPRLHGCLGPCRPRVRPAPPAAAAAAVVAQYEKQRMLSLLFVSAVRLTKYTRCPHRNNRKGQRVPLSQQVPQLKCQSMTSSARVADGQCACPLTHSLTLSRQDKRTFTFPACVSRSASFCVWHSALALALAILRAQQRARPAPS